MNNFGGLRQMIRGFVWLKPESRDLLSELSESSPRSLRGGEAVFEPDRDIWCSNPVIHSLGVLWYTIPAVLDWSESK